MKSSNQFSNELYPTNHWVHNCDRQVAGLRDRRKRQRDEKDEGTLEILNSPIRRKPSAGMWKSGRQFHNSQPQDRLSLKGN